MVDSIVNEKVVARCPQWVWFLIAFLAGMFLLLILLAVLDTGNPRPSNAALWSVGIGPPLLIGLMALYVKRYQIEASESGLRWQGMFTNWRSASWQEVVDFYDVCGPERKQDHSVVAFRDGQKLTFTRSLEGYAALRNAIVHYATGTGLSTWESRNLKGKPSPSSITASAKMITLMMGNFIALAGLMGAGAIWLPLVMIRNAQRDSTLGWWTWGAVALIEVVCLPLAVLGFYAAVDVWRTERVRTVTLDQTGFRVEEKGVAPWRAHWDEIEAIKHRWNGQTIETPRGVLLATTTMDHYRVFARILVANLPEHIKKAQEPTQEDSRTYRYVYPAFKAVLSLPIALGLALPLVRLLQRSLGIEAQQNYKPVDIIAGYIVFGGLVLLGIWGFWRMYASRIEVSDSGITQIGLSGTTHLRWIDIEKARITGSELLSWYELTGAGKKVRWWMGLPHAAHLNDEVARRVPEVPLDWK